MINDIEKQIKKERHEFFKTFISHELDSFWEDCELNPDRFISTGFYQLDDVLGGGLFEGLYVIGAISSLGKTTFVIQIADYIASQGQDVLYFSLEMPAYEIMAKSISRHTHWYCKDNGFNFDIYAKTARGITTGKRYESYTQEDHGVIYAAEENYKRYADKLFIYDGDGDFGIDQIKSTVEKHIKHAGTAPVVIIDSLHHMASTDSDDVVRSMEEQNTRIIQELKQLSLCYKIPIILITHYPHYDKPISMELFEMDADSMDVLIGLQTKGYGTPNVYTSNHDNPRKVELVVLKNREGKIGSIDFDYYAKFNYFEETK